MEHRSPPIHTGTRLAAWLCRNHFQLPAVPALPPDLHAGVACPMKKEQQTLQFPLALFRVLMEQKETGENAISVF